MCFAIPLKVTKVTGKTAVMENGRVVKLGSLEKVVRGDYLEVYANVAVQKMAKGDALSIRKLIKQSQ